MRDTVTAKPVDLEDAQPASSQVVSSTSTLAAAATSTVTRDVLAEGARVRFFASGSGPPLVLVHDYLESRISWEEVVPLLTSRFRLIVPDLPGFGESEKPPSARFAYGPGIFAEALVELLASIGVNRASFLGQGLGGAVALTIAARHPEAVDKLVLLAPHVNETKSDRPRDAAARLSSVPFVGPIFFKQLFGQALFRRHFARAAGARASVGAAHAARIDRLFEQFDTPAGREAAYATMLAMLDMRTLRASLSRVIAPTLIGCGRDDLQFSVAEARKLARELPRARMESFECGHFPAEECPEDLARATASFLLGTAKGA